MTSLSGARTTARSRRQQVIAAAHLRFQQQGYGPTSLRDIAADAAMSHAGVLRHFSGKPELLETVMGLSDDESETTGSTPADLRTQLLRSSGYATADARLVVSLAGEAIDADHPGHALVERRMASDWGLAAEALRANGVADADASGEALRLCAVAAGLVLQGLYDGAGETPSEYLGEQIALRLGSGSPRPRRRTDAPTPAPSPVSEIIADSINAMDRKRARIVSAAFARFAANGYGGATLRAIAESAGMAHSSLLRHFPTKESLVMEVVRLRDFRDIVAAEELIHAPDPSASLREFVHQARANAELTNVIELYTRLSCEAVYPSHPCHGYFARRLAHFRDVSAFLFSRAIDAGIIGPDRDPAFEARILLALWDGLQRYKAYFPDIDVAAHLQAHLDSITTVRLF